MYSSCVEETIRNNSNVERNKRLFLFENNQCNHRSFHFKSYESSNYPYTYIYSNHLEYSTWFTNYFLLSLLHFLSFSSFCLSSMSQSSSWFRLFTEGDAEQWRSHKGCHSIVEMRKGMLCSTAIVIVCVFFPFLLFVFKVFILLTMLAYGMYSFGKGAKSVHNGVQFFEKLLKVNAFFERSKWQKGEMRKWK